MRALRIADAIDAIDTAWQRQLNTSDTQVAELRARVQRLQEQLAEAVTALGREREGTARLEDAVRQFREEQVILLGALEVAAQDQARSASMTMPSTTASASASASTARSKQRGATAAPEAPASGPPSTGASSGTRASGSTATTSRRLVVAPDLSFATVPADRA